MKDPKKDKHRFIFAGFRSPNYTQVPDELFDELLPDLTGAELKVLLYIIRRTFGFKKDSDTISLSQMLTGITRKDGDTQDRGVGLSKVALLHALRSLQEENLIVTERRQSEEKGNEPTNYRLNIVSAVVSGDNHSKETKHPLVKKVYQGVGKKSIPSPRYKNLTTQETVLQETDKQQQDVVASKTLSSNPPTSGGGETDNEVVEALTAFGISKLTVERLLQTYPDGHLLSKLELAQFLVDTKSPLVAKNPAGYLRKSIEDDYNPPKGYKPKAQKEAEARERNNRERQEREERHRTEKEARQARTDVFALLDKQYPPTQIPGTEFTTRTGWEAVKAYLRDTLPEFQYSLLEDTMLVLVERGTAEIGTTNRFLCRYLANRLSSVLKQAFEITFKRPLQPHLQVITVSSKEVSSK